MKNYRVIKGITINATPDIIFDALTTSDEIIKFFPLNEVISTWKKGEPVNYKGEVNGQEFTDYGVITELSRPRKYTYTYWSDNHGTERTPGNHLDISYSLSPINNMTCLNVVQSNIKSEEMFNIMDTVVWDMLLKSLKQHIESGL